MFALSAEALLLYRFVARAFGRRAALGALLFDFLSALTLARGRSVLSWPLMPAELLLCVELGLSRHAWLRFTSGLLCGIFLLDYEGWLAGGWAVVLLVLASFGANRRELRAWLPGMVLGLSISAFLSLGNLETYFSMRHGMSLYEGASSSPWARSLLGLLWGGEVLPGVGGARNHPGLAPWAWIPLGLGLVHCLGQERRLLLWIMVGCLPLCARSSGLVELNRAMAAWPAFCALAGIGWQRLPMMLGDRWRATLAIPILAAGMALEAVAFLSSQDHYDAAYYSTSRAMRAAADWLIERSRKKPIALLSNLGYQRASEFEWLCSGARLDFHSDCVVALIPYEALRALESENKGWQSFKEPQGIDPVTLYEAREPWLSRLRGADQWLGAFWPKLGRFNLLRNIEILSQALADNKLQHPWVRTSLWWRRMVIASSLGRVDESTLSELRREYLLHAGPLYFPSFYLRKFDPVEADELLQAARRLDPRLRLSGRASP
jgi:hypothetical protein